MNENFSHRTETTYVLDLDEEKYEEAEYDFWIEDVGSEVAADSEVAEAAGKMVLAIDAVLSPLVRSLDHLSSLVLKLSRKNSLDALIGLGSGVQALSTPRKCRRHCRCGC